MRGDKRKNAGKICGVKCDVNCLLSASVPTLDVVQVVEPDFQSLGGVVWDLVDRGLILLRRQRFFLEFHLLAPQGTEPYAALPFQFMLIVMKIYFGYLAVRGTTPMHDWVIIV